ncbi:hypothetical protein DUNSADRAFT_9118 [Dunaliella salina]|uniref:BTB domain-containing protein n=1 Tax=Dunaliella salina TaxID=3046 RepID=A0ABQ7GI52_DUNSA|nr:hypothetical protein DUNSADRAFT_9118 [Dunaliella salina]|eukprot:KAF5834295.1 hypothetical protein DUNSADRAFT_9118 [Dunaliella salina]
MAEGTPPPGTDAGKLTCKTNSKTVTDTLVGEHSHHIVGYSLIKGIGDGEPIASERFTVGGHEWVLLFYPDGKRSSSSEGHGGGADLGQVERHQVPPPPGQQPGLIVGIPPNHAGGDLDGPQGSGGAVGGAGAPPAVAAPGQLQGHQHHHPTAQQALQHLQALQPPRPQNIPLARRDTTNEYAALFVALIGEGPNPQGVVNTSDGKVVRAFHRFTLVDQTGQGRDLTKGRTRDAGAVKISCARQMHSSALHAMLAGGALSRNSGPSNSRSELVRVPTPSLGEDLGQLLMSGEGTDCEFAVEDEVMRVHKIILEARSPVFHALLTSPMREGQEGRVKIVDIKAPVFRALLHFVYTDSLPEEHEGPNLDVPMAQHLLVAADQYQLTRLRRICERRLCETVNVETVATTLTLAEQNHAEDLKKVCLDFVSRNLAAVMATDGYRHMTSSCAQLQAEILATIATAAPGNDNHRDRATHHHTATGGANALGGGFRSAPRVREHAADDELRRVRPRRE